MEEFLQSVVNTNLADFAQTIQVRFLDPLKKQYKNYKGLDGVTSKRYRAHSLAMVKTTQRQILSPSSKLDEHGNPRSLSRLTFTPFEKFDVPKRPGSSETRPLCKASISSILGQKLISNYLIPKLESNFLVPESYAYRPKKTAKQAIQRLQTALSQGYLNVLDADIRKFFDTVDHNILLAQMAHYFPGEYTLQLLIRRFLKTGYIDVDKFPRNSGSQKFKIRSPKAGYTPRHLGIPQGGLISGPLANIYLHALDCYIKDNFPDVIYIRYADDFVILSKSQEQVQHIRECVCIYLLQVLKLQIHPKKTHVRDLSLPRHPEHEPFVDFLGYRITQDKVKIQPKNMDAFKAKLLEVIAKWESSEKMEQRLVTMVNRRLLGRMYDGDIYAGYKFIGKNWTSYFSLVTQHEQLQQLDHWLSRQMILAILRKHQTRRTRKDLRQRKLIQLVTLHYKMKRRNRQWQRQRKALLTTQPITASKATF